MCEHSERVSPGDDDGKEGDGDEDEQMSSRRGDGRGEYSELEEAEALGQTGLLRALRERSTRTDACPSSALPSLLPPLISIDTRTQLRDPWQFRRQTAAQTAVLLHCTHVRRALALALAKTKHEARYVQSARRPDVDAAARSPRLDELSIGLQQTHRKKLESDKGAKMDGKVYENE
ncbi:hypothetical protein SCHPADRAFT_945631 [Schizopora paradoxa]|uniref:Uncharacterized protein n=1 Tax=Schizopora paradoxa TaxID=27342 RepID=A0A0H2RC00_9AGAM|nr:hypothetical protein SCHPADRAFT_945631 [Schizopora paradoxa]